MSKTYVTIEELANHLSVSVSTIRGWVRNKHIPGSTYIRVVNTYRFCLGDVVDALTATRDKPAVDPVEVAVVDEQDEDL